MKRLMAFLLAALLLTMPLFASADTFNTEHATAYLECKFQCGCTRGGVGAMIGRYGLITAAHNLYCHTHAQGLSYCNFYFGARTAGSCWYQYSGKFTYTVYNTFSNGYNSNDDIGYVIFDSPVGNTTGWFGYLVGDDSDLHYEYMHMMYFNTYRHSREEFTIMQVYNDKQVYWEGRNYNYGGGPVFLWYEGMEFPRVVAVYTSDNSDGYSFGRRLTSDIIRDMRMDGAFD